jgi:hypothetical protein
VDAGGDGDDAEEVGVGEADGVGLGDGDDVVGVGVGVREADEDDLGDADALGDLDECTDDDAAALADSDGPRDDDALAEEETGREAGTPEGVRPADVDAADEETCAAGDGIVAGVCRVKAVTAKLATPAATRKPTIHASASGRHLRRRGRLPPPPGGGRYASPGGYVAPGGYAPPGGCVLPGGTGMLSEVAAGEYPAGARSRLSPLGAGAAESARVVRVAASNPSAASDPSAAPDPSAVSDPNGTAVVTGAEPGAASPANARMTDSGSQLAVGWRAPTSASRLSAVGRCRGSLARQRSISGRTSAGTLARPGVPWTTRYSSAAVVPAPNGPSPVAAKARTAPRLNMSVAIPTS